MINQEQLKKYIHYDPDTGIFTRIKSDSNAHKHGKHLKPNTARGYIEVSVCGYRQFAHRFAFLYMTGEMPVKGVDHINGDCTDNRWENLRQATQKENMRNRRVSKNNSSGVLGVAKCSTTNKWKAYITINDKQIHLGRHDNISDAILARENANKMYGFHDNHGRHVR